MGRIEDNKIRLASLGEPVVGEPECRRATPGDEVERHCKFVVLKEAGTVADQIGASNHVAIAVRPPAVATGARGERIG